MQGIRLAVGILGVVDMLHFGGAMVIFWMDWSAAIKQHLMLGNMNVILIAIAGLLMIAAVGLVNASFLESRIKSMRSCHLWLCFSITILCVSAVLAYFFLLTFGFHTYTVVLLLEFIFRAIAVTLVIQFLKTLGCEIFSSKSEQVPTAAEKVPQNQFIA